MIPVWFFFVLIGLICYLLYITRTTEDTLLVMGKNNLKKMNYWFRSVKSRQSA
jgi:hypothetical protein